MELVAAVVVVPWVAVVPVTGLAFIVLKLLIGHMK